MTEKFIHVNPNKNRTPRHRAREFALQGVYCWLLNQDDTGVIDAHIREAHGFDKADAAYFDVLIHGVIKNVLVLRDYLQPLIDRPLTQLSPIEHAALLLGAYELAHQFDIPYRVVINEAVELTKSFGGTEGHRYVNGVLDKFAAQIRLAETSVIQNKIIHQQ